MTTDAPRVGDPGFHLRGNFAPVEREVTAHDLPVTGSLPAQLRGAYLRNGPNPRRPSDHWFLGDGMVHGVRLDDGRARWYRNRWVRTESFADPSRSLYDRRDGSRDLHVSVANTNVVRHGGRLLALVESSLPYELSAELETLGCHDFDGALRDSMTAHPKTCPVTGELHFFGYGSLRAPYVTYHRADASGRITHEQGIDVPGLTMMHDFALTAAHVVFLDLPVVFDLELALAGAGLPYRWSQTYGARLGVMRRDDPGAPIRWHAIEPCYVFHVANAFERAGAGGGDELVVHAIRYEHMWRDGAFDADGAPWEWVLDLGTGAVRERQLDDRACEMPRIDDRRTGAPSEVFYAMAPGAIVRYEVATGRRTAHRFADGDEPGEPTFVPAAGSSDERDGYLITYVHRRDTDRSDLVVLSAGDLAAEPLASVHVPARVPNGFHGNWFADA